MIDPHNAIKEKWLIQNFKKGLDGKDVLEEFLRGIYIIDRRKAEEWKKKITYII